MKTQHLKWTLLALPALSVSLGSCGGGSGAEADEINLDTVKAEIQALENGYAEGLMAGDVNAVAAYYAEDAQSMADHEPTRVGIEAIKAGIARDMAEDTGDYVISFEVTGVWAAGNIAVETGASTVKDKEGNVVETGKYMTLFEKRDGKYVAIRDIWNEDAEDDEDEDEEGDVDENDEEDDGADDDD